MNPTCNCAIALVEINERLRNLERLHGFELAAIKCSERIAKTPKRSMQSKLRAVAELTAKQFGLSHSMLLSKKRSEGVAMARFVAYKLQRELCDASLETIAEFWKKDHSTIIYGIDRAKEMMETSESMRAYDATLRASFAEALR